MDLLGILWYKAFQKLEKILKKLLAESEERYLVDFSCLAKKVISNAPGEKFYKKNRNWNCLSLKLFLLTELYERSILMKLSVSPLWSTRSEVAKGASYQAAKYFPMLKKETFLVLQTHVYFKRQRVSYLFTQFAIQSVHRLFWKDFPFKWTICQMKLFLDEPKLKCSLHGWGKMQF